MLAHFHHAAGHVVALQLSHIQHVERAPAECVHRSLLIMTNGDRLPVLEMPEQVEEKMYALRTPGLRRVVYS